MSPFSYATPGIEAFFTEASLVFAYLVLRTEAFSWPLIASFPPYGSIQVHIGNMKLMYFANYLLWLAYQCFIAHCNESHKRLFDDLLTDYNKLRRPRTNDSQPLVVRLKMKLSQIIDVNEKEQIMTISVWLKQIWKDMRLHWEPAHYGNVSVLYVPAEMLWTPDLLLFNNAAASYNITIQSTKVTLHPSGVVDWEPPALFKSMCPINVLWFPFDTQNCTMNFGSRTYTADQLDLRHLWEENVEANDNEAEVLYGIDLTEYYPSVEWQILAIPAKRRNKTYRYGHMVSTYVDITYEIKLRRLPLFYTVNIIFPVVGISFLTIFVFYLPSDSGEKISLSISILVSLTVFFMLLTEIIPATSDVLPMIGKYLLFTMFMVSVSVVVSVIVLNVHFRTPATHRMPKWVKKVFLKTLPKYLFMTRPLGDEESFRRVNSSREYFGDPSSAVSMTSSLRDNSGYRIPQCHHRYPSGTSSAPSSLKERVIMTQKMHHLRLPGEADTKEEDSFARKLESLYYDPAVLKAFSNICFIADLLKKKDRDDKIDEDWKYVAMVMDRIFLWIFAIVCLLGSALILLQADALYDNTEKLERILSKYRKIENITF